MTRALVVAAALILAATGTAAAYPQFQLTTGAARCNQCHVAPAGGGLLSAYGRSESADTISRGGDGDFLHGAWSPPSWLLLGADVRVAAGVHDNDSEDSPETLAFPMQADVYAHARGGQLSLTVIGGLRGGARSEDPTATSWVVSREHYLMWRRRALGPYVRAGRFQPPYGLRLAEHPTYVRRFAGFGLYEEPYGLSAGWLQNEWEVHASVYRPDFFRPVRRETGGALVGEKRLLAGTAAVGLQAKIGVAEHYTNHEGGAYAKYWLGSADVLFMGEADVIHQTIDDTDYANWQLAGYLGGFWFPTRGVMVGAAGELWHEDLRTPDLARLTANLQVHWFPRAHFELMLYGRLARFDSKLVLLQLHYYL